jgi:2-phosphoglycerate kinase
MAERAPTISLSMNGRRIPFSKGLLAQSFMATGLQPGLAFGIAQAVQDELTGRGEDPVTVAKVREVARDRLQELAGPQYARRYVRLRDLSHMRRPLIVLIGGTTGVGKSTIATEVAHRLGITRISSTDSIREVMRGIFTADLMPAIHESAFSAWRGLRVPVPEGANPVIVGFREQTAVVSTGIKALIDRAVLEGNSMVVEGIHLVPGYLDLDHVGNARVVELIVGVKDEQSHLSHFYIREAQTEGSRPRERYISNFENIRLLGEYIQRLAREHEIPIIYSHDLDRTIDDVLEYLITAAIDTERPAASADER